MADGTRTHDNRNHNPGLYQLSYSHRRAHDYSERPSTLALRPARRSGRALAAASRATGRLVDLALKRGLQRCVVGLRLGVAQTCAYCASPAPRRRRPGRGPHVLMIRRPRSLGRRDRHADEAPAASPPAPSSTASSTARGRSRGWARETISVLSGERRSARRAPSAASRSAPSLRASAAACLAASCWRTRSFTSASGSWCAGVYWTTRPAASWLAPMSIASVLRLFSRRVAAEQRFEELAGWRARRLRPAPACASRAARSSISSLSLSAAGLGCRTARRRCR